jgi:hypothetical protein
MHLPRGLRAVLAGLLLPAVVAAADTGGRAEYVGGTVRTLRGGVDGRIQATHAEHFVFLAKGGAVRIAYNRINLIEYGQKVGRRYAMAILISPLLILSKKRQHFLTVGYTDEQGQQQALVFRLDKSDIRFVLVSLEARTGQKVQYQDDEARKAGRG